MQDDAVRQQIEAAFDLLAPSYDAEMARNPSMGRMRAVSLETLTSAFAPGQYVLEIGCGTGVEATAMARRGVKVMATDLSREMVRATDARVQQAGLEHLVHTRHMAAADLGELVLDQGELSFDGAYASFGALNGEVDLAPVASALGQLIRPGGELVLGIMNRYYLAEMLWYLSHGNTRQAFRRWSGAAQASVSSELALSARTVYFGYRAVRRAFDADFLLRSCRALPLSLPPPYLASLWDRRPRLVRLLSALDEALARRWPFRVLGDHLLLVLERRPTG